MNLDHWLGSRMFTKQLFKEVLWPSSCVWVCMDEEFGCMWIFGGESDRRDHLMQWTVLCRDKEDQSQ